MKLLTNKSLIAFFLITSFNAFSAQESSPWIGTKAGEKAPQQLNIPKELSKNLATFDELDFKVYSKQDWENLHKSHAANILVHYPDGHTTVGIPAHIKELEFMWTFAPDNRIEEHPVRFGTSDAKWTAVIGAIKGTFTKPMILADGTKIEPTGKSYNLPMATIGHWNKDGQMDEEYLFWDNAEFIKQIGLSK
ncbi:ester cyclase [Klebsiella variicola]|uniref:ester cyclase n=1 Tax=Klebsiella variicola TaxID=244366 RepID=UPI0014331316|nr:ester cyclase [Klebsiella variicola]MCH6141794.1 ester cyclase [Klebsiella variicola]MCH6176671.1 ester cyclase [Klebsiella variicola]NKD43498.1 ester cyclase [Escherichia coli]